MTTLLLIILILLLVGAVPYRGRRYYRGSEGLVRLLLLIFFIWLIFRYV
jgi:hypothetical protein